MKQILSDHEFNSFRYYLLATTLVLFLLVVAGNLTRVSGAAFACPDWPTCFGQWGLPAGQAGVLQGIHRGLALLSTLMILGAGYLAWAARRYPALVTRALLLAGIVMLAQIVLGAGFAWWQKSLLLSLLHFSLAMIALGLTTAATLAAFYSKNPLSHGRLVFTTPFSRLAGMTLAAVFLLMVSGTVVAGQACTGWPLCTEGWPSGFGGWLHLAHRLLTLVAGGLALSLFLTAWRSQRSQRVILTAATSAFVLFAGQVLIGALKATRGFPSDLVVLHASSAASLWVVLVVLVTAAGLTARTASEEKAEAAQEMRFRQRVRDFIQLSKPVIVLLLLVTTFTGMVVGGGRLPDLSLAFWTLLGGALAAGGSSAINQYIDRDLDRAMQRTARRPLPSGRLTFAEGLAFGTAACLTSFFLLAGFVNLLAALLSLAGMVYYILVYSVWLKRLTVQNIVIGGGGGAIPPLVGWAAATGSLNIPSLFLFAIIFLWTPPHFWALALLRLKDYARAGVPMMPVIRGEKETRRQIFFYTLQLVGITLLMPALKLAGGFFLASALILGLWLIHSAWRVLKAGGNKTAWKMYRYSSMYLGLLFLALVFDVLV